MVKRLIRNVLIWLDEGLNALTLGNPGETVSSRAAKARVERKHWGRVLCRWLDALDRHHCANSLLPDAGSRAIVKH